jgi:hypothetical protein
MARAAKQGKELEKARKQAARWSLDPKNNYGTALITYLGGKMTISSDASPGIEVLAKYVDGKEVPV